MKSNWKGILLWSNQFYGICAALLAVDTGITLLHKVPSVFALLLVYLVTIIFYTHAYLQESNGGIYGERSEWYQKNKNYLNIRQIVFTIACLYLMFIHFNGWLLFWSAGLIIKIILTASFLISAVYYVPYKFLSITLSFRKLGLLKSMSIAWVWAITCCFVPFWIEENSSFSLRLTTIQFWNYFFQLFIYILMLAILFDIKDLFRDKEEAINTLVVKHGVRKTVHSFILPLLFIYAIITLFIYFNEQYKFTYLVAHSILIIATYWVALQIEKIKSIHGNILLIDGLMYFKAILSIVYMTHIH